jgi:hypothetical protein
LNDKKGSKSDGEEDINNKAGAPENGYKKS